MYLEVLKKSQLKVQNLILMGFFSNFSCQIYDIRCTKKHIGHCAKFLSKETFGLYLFTVPHESF